jgi:hypothetical protein
MVAESKDSGVWGPMWCTSTYRYDVGARRWHQQDRQLLHAPALEQRRWCIRDLSIALPLLVHARTAWVFPELLKLPYPELKVGGGAGMPAGPPFLQLGHWEVLG